MSLLGRLVRRFVRSDSGNFSMMFALLSIPVVTCVGLAIDYGRASTNRATMQNALDAAAWYGVSLPKETSDKERKEKTQLYYVANGGVGTITDISYEVSPKAASLNLKSDFKLPTTFMGLAQVPYVQLAVDSKVQLPVKLKSAKFEVIKAAGNWSKTVTLFGRDEVSQMYQPLMEIVYPGMQQPLSAAKIYQIDPVTKVKTLSRTGDIDVGHTDSLIVQMNVTATDNQIKQDILFDLVRLLGLNNLLGTTTVAVPRAIRSDDKQFTKRLYITKKVDGVMKTMESDGSDIYTRLGCDETEEQAWEDGGSLQRKESSKNTWVLLEGLYNKYEQSSTVLQRRAITDFAYKVTGRCEASSGAGARLME